MSMCATVRLTEASSQRGWSTPHLGCLVGGGNRGESWFISQPPHQGVTQMFRKTKFGIALTTAAVAVTAFAGAADASSQSTVSILGTNGDYYGYVHSSDATHCENNRKVVVYKQ